MSTTSLRHVIRDAPQPAKLVKPPERSNSASEVIELAESAGLILDPWQCLALDAMMGEDDDGNWAATQAGLVVPRQSGKGSVAEARELAGLFLLGEKRLIHTAHLFKTCNDAFLRVISLIENTPDLSRRVRQIRRGSGEQGVWLKSGATLQFVARSGKSGRGLGGDFLLLDEAFHLSPVVMTALVPTLSAAGGNRSGNGTQVWFTSSPPVLEYLDEGRTIRRLRDRANSAEPGPMAWVEYGCELGVDLDDKSNWYAANPSLGIRITERAVMDERALLDDDGFAVERLGVWMPEPSDQSSAVFTAEAWAACVEETSAPSDPVTFGLEVMPDRDTAVIAAVGDWNGRPCAEIVAMGTGTGWVVDRLIELTANHDYTAVAIDARSAAGSFIAPLEEAGVRVEVYNTRNIINAAGRLFDAVNAADIAKRLAHRGDPRLGSAVLAANRRVIGDAWAFGRRSSSSSIIAVVALSLALLAHETPVEVEAPPRPVFAW